MDFLRKALIMYCTKVQTDRRKTNPFYLSTGLKKYTGSKIPLRTLRQFSKKDGIGERRNITLIVALPS